MFYMSHQFEDDNKMHVPLYIIKGKSLDTTAVDPHTFLFFWERNEHWGQIMKRRELRAALGSLRGCSGAANAQRGTK
jgi:hypothetical protein